MGGSQVVGRSTKSYEGASYYVWCILCGLVKKTFASYASVSPYEKLSVRERNADDRFPPGGRNGLSSNLFSLHGIISTPLVAALHRLVRVATGPPTS